jgi:hypothetical protein
MGDGEGPRQLRGDKADGHEIESPGCVAVRFESGDGCLGPALRARETLSLAQRSEGVAWRMQERLARALRGRRGRRVMAAGRKQ